MWAPIETTRARPPKQAVARRGKCLIRSCLIRLATREPWAGYRLTALGVLMGRPETMGQAWMLARDNGYSPAIDPKQ
jgi:hypothetical protein